MKVETADDLVRRRADNAAKLAGRSARITTVAGSRFADRCARVGCSSTEHRGVHNSALRREIERCVRCATPWPWELVETPRSGRRRHRGGDHDRRLVEFVSDGRLLDAVPQRTRELFEGYMRDGAVTTASRYSVTVYQVYHAVRSARRAVEARIELARLCGEPV